MPELTARAPRAAALLDLDRRSLGVRAVAVVAGSLVLAASSHVAVPMVPVPVTMQSFAVLMIGVLFGWRLGTLTVLAWLGEGALGLSVFAPGGAPGILRFVGPTAGYLWAFPVAAALVGWLAERGCNGARPVRAFAAMLAGNLLCLVLGGLWLATLIGVGEAMAVGVMPFLIGALLKSALAAATLALLQTRGI